MNTQEVVRLSDMGDLATLVPYLVGYEPRSAAALIGLKDEDDTSARILGTCVTKYSEGGKDVDVWHEAIRTLTTAGATSILPLFFNAERQESEKSSKALASALCRFPDLRKHDDVIICQGRYFDSPGSKGRPLPQGCGAASAFVFAGLAPLPTREALMESFTPASHPHAAQVERACEALDGSSTTREVLRCLADVVSAREGVTGLDRLPAQTLAMATLGLADPRIRDAVSTWLLPRRLARTAPRSAESTAFLAMVGPSPESITELAAQGERLRQWLTMCPDTYAGYAAQVVGLFKWTHGDCPVAAHLFDIATRGPAAKMAELCRTAALQGITP